MRPFLKWAGGKYRVLPHILNFLPSGNRLIEPFAGSGAVFLNTEYRDYLICDANEDLMNLYSYIKDGGDEFINYARTFFTPENNTQDSYYRLRETFNLTAKHHEKAAIFIYLNRHCFNGLCRYNNKGMFNVPYGRYTKPEFPLKEITHFFLKSKTAEFKSQDFLVTMEQASLGDVVYCDPPYVPLSDTSNFTSYSTSKFGLEEQKKLADMALKLQNRGIPVVVSNHKTDFTQDIYKHAQLIEFDVQRNISCDGENRNKVRELLAIYL